MGTRRKSRELTLQMLFQSDMGKQSAEQVRKNFWAERGDTDVEVREFADEYNHRKEEGALFPALEEAGLPPQGPVAVMLYEHSEGRKLLKQIGDAPPVFAQSAGKDVVYVPQPTEVVEMLNEYFSLVTVPILEQGGNVNKYIGDAVMSFWNAPIRVPGHARQAFSAALVGRKALDTANAQWKAAGLPVFVTRMGINTGEVIVGNIGSSVRLNYTIIGDAVNLASRIEGLNRVYGTQTLISEATRANIGGDFLTRPVDLVAVKGKSFPVLVHELLGWKSKAPEKLVELAASTSAAHALLVGRNYGQARLRGPARNATQPSQLAGASPGAGRWAR